MNQFVGKAVNQGVVFGSIHILNKQQCDIKAEIVQDRDAEGTRFVIAKETAKLQVQELYQKAHDEGSEESAAILQAQLVMLEDEEYRYSVAQKIEKEYWNAEYAVHKKHQGRCQDQR